MRNIDFASKALNKITKRIDDACAACARDPDSVMLLGASKKQSIALIEDFHHAGLKNVGENYLQEALHKQSTLIESALHWHFIGTIQSNKCQSIARHFSWVHSVDRLKIAQRLSDYRHPNQPINLLVQLNVDDESAKSGVSPQAAPQLCAQISKLKNIRLRGFMLIPKARHGFIEQRRPFALARQLCETINTEQNLQMDSLSMGMSNDLEAAIYEGATIVRIGSDLFGPRDTEPE